jgi:hypothetical protein
VVGCQGLEPLDRPCPHPHGCNTNDDIKKIILIYTEMIYDNKMSDGWICEKLCYWIGKGQMLIISLSER